MPPTGRHASDDALPLLPLGSRVRIMRKRPYSGVPVGAVGRVMKHHRHQWPYEVRIEGTVNHRYLFAVADVAPINAQGDIMDEAWKFNVGDRVVINVTIHDANGVIEAGTPGEVIETRHNHIFPYRVRFDSGLEQLCHGYELDPAEATPELAVAS